MNWHFCAETGLHYNRYRYYDPDAADYLTPDPIGIDGGLRSFGYVQDPMGWVDPLGLIDCDLPDNPKKVNKTYIEHATTRVADQADVDDLSRTEIRDELRDLGNDIEKNGWPSGTITDAIRPDSVLVPYRGGYVVYRVKNNGNAVIRTFLNAK